MISKSDIKKIKLFIQENTDEKEARYVYSLFAKHENNPKFKQLFKNDFYEFIEKYNEEKEQNLIYLLDRIHQIIHKKENKKKFYAVKNIFRWYSFAAAVLLILLLIIEGNLSISQEEENTSIAETQVANTLFPLPGSSIKFILLDGTEGSFSKQKIIIDK